MRAGELSRGMVLLLGYLFNVSGWFWQYEELRIKAAACAQLDEEDFTREWVVLLCYDAEKYRAEVSIAFGIPQPHSNCLHTIKRRPVVFSCQVGRLSFAASQRRQFWHGMGGNRGRGERREVLGLSN